MNFLFTFVSLYFFCFSTLTSQVKPVLDKLRADSDLDVQFFASESQERKYRTITLYEM